MGIIYPLAVVTLLRCEAKPPTKDHPRAANSKRKNGRSMKIYLSSQLSPTFFWKVTFQCPLVSTLIPSHHFSIFNPSFPSSMARGEGDCEKRWEGSMYFVGTTYKHTQHLPCNYYLLFQFSLWSIISYLKCLYTYCTGRVHLLFFAPRNLDSSFLRNKRFRLWNEA